MRENDPVLAILDKVDRGLATLSDQLAELKAQAKFIEDRMAKLRQYVQQTRVILIAEDDTIEYEPKLP
jgi:hypothetical protein